MIGRRTSSKKPAEVPIDTRVDELRPGDVIEPYAAGLQGWRARVVNILPEAAGGSGHAGWWRVDLAWPQGAPRGSLDENERNHPVWSSDCVVWRYGPPRAAEHSGVDRDQQAKPAAIVVIFAS